MVRLPAQNIVVHFPRSLFAEQDTATGTTLSYQIIRRPNGTRYQRFVPLSVPIDKERVKQAVEALAQIKLRSQK